MMVSSSAINSQGLLRICGLVTALFMMAIVLPQCPEQHNIRTDKTSLYAYMYVHV